MFVDVLETGGKGSVVEDGIPAERGSGSPAQGVRGGGNEKAVFLGANQNSDAIGEFIGLSIDVAEALRCAIG